MKNWYSDNHDIRALRKALHTDEARYLLQSLPDSVGRKLVQCYFCEDGDSLKEVLDYFGQNSDMARYAKIKPGSAHIFQYLYGKDPICKPIDLYFIRSNVGHSMYKRLIALKENLSRLIAEELVHHDGRLMIDNIGSGPGHDMIDVLAEHPELSSKVHVRNIDPDSAALEIGRKRVESLGLSDSFSSINKNFEEVDDFDAHMILLIGIFCPMKRRICELILKRLGNLYRPGTLVIYSTVQKRMKHGDLLMRFIMEFIGWHMDYKTDEETEAIARATGWKPLEQFFDEPLRYNCIQVARSKPQ
jgi:hypothetical protein